MDKYGVECAFSCDRKQKPIKIGTKIKNDKYVRKRGKIYIMHLYFNANA